MEILGAVAAFAVVMIVFSTAVSGVVEVLLRLSAERPEALFRAVRGFAQDSLAVWVEKDAGREGEALFDAESAFRPAAGSGATEPPVSARRRLYLDVMAEIAKDGGTSAGDARTRFAAAYVAKQKQSRIDALVDQLTLNPLHLADGKHSLAGLDRVARRRALWTAGIDTLTTYALIQRLAKSEVGGVLADTARHELRPILDDLTRTFERYVASSNELFRKNANGVAVLVAFALAFGTNFDASRVFNHLVKNPSIADALIAQGETAAKDYAAAAKKLEERLASLEAAAPQDEAASDGVPHADPLAALSDADKAKIADGLKADIANLTATLKPIVEEGDLPFGADYYPYCLASVRGFLDDPLAAPRRWVYGLIGNSKSTGGTAPAEAATPGAAAPKAETDRQAAAPPPDPCRDGSDRSILVWLLNVLLAGALISLGGPFWYKVFASASRLAQLARQLAGGARSEKVGPEGEKEEGKKPETEDPLKTFETAQAGARAKKA